MFKVIIFLVISAKICETARILAIMPTPSYSHQIVYNPLWIALNSRGHHVTLLTTDPIKKNLTNFRQIDLSFTYPLWHEIHNATDIIKNFKKDFLKCLRQYKTLIEDTIVQELEHPEVLGLIKGNEHFDLVIVELLSPFMAAFSVRFKCPFIAVSPMDMMNFAHQSWGNPVALFPDPILTSFDVDMSFFERVENFVSNALTRMFYEYLYSSIDKILVKYFGEIPTLVELQKNASLVFLNINPVMNGMRPTVPHVMMVGGGSHLESGEALPSEIQRFLEDAENGVIYFSLGTNVKSGDVTVETQQAFIDAFTELPYKVIWKTDSKDVESNPKFLVKKWLPQQDILKNPKIKLFITQGGLQSLEEAVYNEIPIIGIPFFVDQFSNVRRMVRKGLGIQLDLENINKNVIKNAIEEVIGNEKYKKCAAKLSVLLKEQPISGLDQAVWWTEYVIKYKGARFLKPEEVPFYQYILLDVLLFLICLLSLAVYCQYKFVRFLVSFIKAKRSKNYKQKVF